MIGCRDNLTDEESRGWIGRNLDRSVLETHSAAEFAVCRCAVTYKRSNCAANSSGGRNELGDEARCVVTGRVHSVGQAPVYRVNGSKCLEVHTNPRPFLRIESGAITDKY